MVLCLQPNNNPSRDNGKTPQEAFLESLTKPVTFADSVFPAFSFSFPLPIPPGFPGIPSFWLARVGKEKETKEPNIYHLLDHDICLSVVQHI